MSSLVIIIEPILPEGSRRESLCVYNYKTSLIGQFKYGDICLDSIEITEDFMNEYILIQTGYDPKTTKMKLSRSHWDKNSQDYTFEKFKAMIDFYKQIIETNKQQEEFKKKEEIEKQKELERQRQQQRIEMEKQNSRKIKLHELVNEGYELLKKINQKRLDEKFVQVPITLIKKSDNQPFLSPSTCLEFRKIKHEYYAMCFDSNFRCIVSRNESLKGLSDDLKTLGTIWFYGGELKISDLYFNNMSLGNYLTYHIGTILIKLDQDLNSNEYEQNLQLVCSSICSDI